jgi:hypothetical protein
MPSPVANFMTRELIVYSTLRALADNMPDDEIAIMLDRITATVEGIKTTTLYKRTLAKLHSNDFPMPDTVSKMLADLDHDHPNLDSHTILWLIGLRCAATMDDADPSHAIQTQLMLFLASQSSDFYRIADDRMRLLVTYTYLQTTTHILFRTDDN